MDDRCYLCGETSGELLSGSKTHLKCERDIWASNKRNGWVIAFLLMPIALVGFLVGIVSGALKAGFSEGLGLWETAFTFLQKPRP